MTRVYGVLGVELFEQLACFEGVRFGFWSSGDCITRIFGIYSHEHGMNSG